jgi:hypothetical protein
MQKLPARISTQLLMALLTLACILLVSFIIVALIYSSQHQSNQTLTQSSSSSVSTISSSETSVQASSFSTTSVPAASDDLPLGDQKYTTSPKKGYIFLCNTNFSANAGAFKDGGWIDSVNGVWHPSKKVTVDGDVSWPNASFKITTSASNRIITGNDLPILHKTGVFPIQSIDDAYTYDHNPNQIKVQSYTLSLPLLPLVANSPNCIGGEVGVTLSGVALFDGFDAGGRDAVAHEVQDKCDGHPQVDGQYHYHDLSKCIDSDQDSDGNAKLVGYALDGFGIFGPVEKNKRLVTDDLDECHGHTHEVMWDGKLTNIYHYHATADFPYTVGCFKGTPVRKQLILSTGGGGVMPPPQR